MKRAAIKKRPLSDTVLANLDPEEKDYRERDTGQLYFLVNNNFLFNYSSKIFLFFRNLF